MFQHLPRGIILPHPAACTLQTYLSDGSWLKQYKIYKILCHRLHDAARATSPVPEMTSLSWGNKTKQTSECTRIASTLEQNACVYAYLCWSNHLQSLLSSINAFSVGLKPSLLVTLVLHFVKYHWKGCMHNFTNKSIKQFPQCKETLLTNLYTSNWTSATSVCGARLVFLLWIYSLGLLSSC